MGSRRCHHPSLLISLLISFSGIWDTITMSHHPLSGMSRGHCLSVYQTTHVRPVAMMRFSPALTKYKHKVLQWLTLDLKLGCVPMGFFHSREPPHLLSFQASSAPWTFLPCGQAAKVLEEICSFIKSISDILLSHGHFLLFYFIGFH